MERQNMERSTNALTEELDQEVVDRLSRRETMTKVGKLGAAALAIASVPGMFGALSKSAFAQAGLPQQIKDALNFALTLEYLEAEFYTQGLAASGLIPSTDRAVFQQISKHEDAHVTLLKGVLGSDAVAKPTFDFTANGTFGTVFSDYQVFLALSQGFEDTGVRAYKGQAGELMSNNDILTTALQIHSVEARHASEVRRIRSQKGWITQNNYDSGIPAVAGDPIYGGEQNLSQGGINNVTTITSIGADGVTEAFDEPLAKADVLNIASLFIA